MDPLGSPPINRRNRTHQERHAVVLRFSARDLAMATATVGSPLDRPYLRAIPDCPSKIFLRRQKVARPNAAIPVKTAQDEVSGTEIATPLAAPGTNPVMKLAFTRAPVLASYSLIVPYQLATNNSDSDNTRPVGSDRSIGARNQRCVEGHRHYKTCYPRYGVHRSRTSAGQERRRVHPKTPFP